ncbi:MAG: DNA translocase FtsK 4TM domain-containing protein [Verrucomicrobiota bacterium]
MSSAKKTKQPEPQHPLAPAYRERRIHYGLLFFIAVLFLLSLVSHDSRDSAFLAGGLGTGRIIHNWIGHFGARISRFLLLWFGFASYLLSALLVLCSARRMLRPRKTRPANWDYWIAIPLTALGGAMLLGIWPEALPTGAGALNLAETPGGVLGQRLCAPRSGWLRLILNPTGSALLATALTLLGLSVIWLYDWHSSFLAWMTARKERRATEEPQQETSTKTDAKSKKRAKEIPDEARRKAAARLREEIPAPKQDAPQKTAAATAGKNAKSKPADGKTPKSAPPPPPAAEPPAATKKAGAPKSVKTKSGEEFTLPTIKLLNPTGAKISGADSDEIKQRKEILQATLDSFGIDAKVSDATSGPRVTLFEVLPAPGVKVERVSQISRNIAMELRAISLRMLTPIPGKKSVGIELPNENPETVTVYNLMTSREWEKSKAGIPLLLGRNIRGEAVILDLNTAPHLLIAGATGSGKSVCINLLIISMLYRFTPDQLRMILIDPKVVEFSCYKTLPHLITPVISDTKKVPLALRWVINEMERRYQILAKAGVRNLPAFNNRKKPAEPVLDDEGNPLPDHLPFIVVVIDELADIMMTAKADVETSLARIAQLSRAVGIHTIIATQRPSVNVITGTIKANYPTRIAFQVTSQVDSRTILDGKGAESLLGRGDMLFRPPGASNLERNQGALVDDEEIERIVGFLAEQGEPQFESDVFKSAQSAGGAQPGLGDETGEEDEELIQQAIEIIKRDRRPTTSYIQRCLRIGYNRAALIIETLEQRNVIGPQVGTAPREILIDTDPQDTNDDDQGDIPDTPDDEPSSEDNGKE